MAEMTPEQRLRLATAARRERLAQFGTKLAAYREAGINSATWDRIEAAETVKEHTLVQAIKLLWPNTSGDWTRVPGVMSPYLGYPSAPGEPGDPEYAQYTLGRIEEVEERLGRLEQYVYDREAESSATEVDDAGLADDSARLPQGSGEAEVPARLGHAPIRPDARSTTRTQRGGRKA